MVDDPGAVTIPTAMAGSRTIQAGRRIGKYEILQHLATGGMAEIYLARATGIERFEKLCVIKRILPAAAGNIELVKMLLDEARIAATLHHSNIVQVFDIGEADGEFFICMEYLHGRDVHALLRAARKRGTRLADDEALSIINGVLAGLHYAHDKKDEQDRPLGIVHRDVSPTNVLVTYDGGVKLVDFGLVKAEGRITESRSGSLKGKLAYMSPEQCRARACDRRSDLFSLSIMLWELTTGTRLFTGTCDYDYLSAILETEPTKPSAVVPDYPPELEAIVMKGLQKDPSLRYQTAEDMQIDLEDYCREHKLRVSAITLRRMMEDLFADELKSWQVARTAGLALEDHVVKSLASGSAIAQPPLPRRSEPMAVATPEEDSKPLASRPNAPRRRGWATFALAGVLVLGSVAGTYAVLTRSHPIPKDAQQPANPAPQHTPASAPAPGVAAAPAPAPASSSSSSPSAPASASASAPAPTSAPAAATASAAAVATPTVPDSSRVAGAATPTVPDSAPVAASASPTVPDSAPTIAPASPSTTESKSSRTTKSARAVTKQPPAKQPPAKQLPVKQTTKAHKSSDHDSLFPE